MILLYLNFDENCNFFIVIENLRINFITMTSKKIKSINKLIKIKTP